MTLVVHSKEEGDVAFLTFCEDELYAMGCAEEGTLKTAVCHSYTPLNDHACRHHSGACVRVDVGGQLHVDQDNFRSG
jgi:hypothetical protein